MNKVYPLTFIREGKRSRCVKYERRLVWYAPDTTDKATSIAFCRVSTAILLANSPGEDWYTYEFYQFL